MQAAVIPAVNDTWEVKEVPTPEPGANQVLIKIQVSELCCTDVHVTKGAIPTQSPRPLGYEPVGKWSDNGTSRRSRSCTLCAIFISKE